MKKDKEILDLKEDHDDLFKAVHGLSKKVNNFIRRLKPCKKK